jgi:hypothetical protein
MNSPYAKPKTARIGKEIWCDYTSNKCGFVLTCNWDNQSFVHVCVTLRHFHLFWPGVGMYTEGCTTGHLDTGFLSFTLSPSKCWDRSETSKLLLRVTHVSRIPFRLESINVHPLSLHSTQLAKQFMHFFTFTSKPLPTQVCTQNFSLGEGADPKAMYNFCLILKIVLESCQT